MPVLIWCNEISSNVICCGSGRSKIPDKEASIQDFIKSVKSKIFQIQRLKRTLKTLVDPKRRSLRTKTTNWSTIKYSINLEAIE